MKALITGASSGIGYEMAKYLASKDIDLILVARRKSRLDKMKKEFKNVDVKVIPLEGKLSLEDAKKMVVSGDYTWGRSR